MIFVFVFERLNFRLSEADGQSILPVVDHRLRGDAFSVWSSWWLHVLLVDVFLRLWSWLLFRLLRLVLAFSRFPRCLERNERVRGLRLLRGRLLHKSMVRLVLWWVPVAILIVVEMDVSVVVAEESQLLLMLLWWHLMRLLLWWHLKGLRQNRPELK